MLRARADSEGWLVTIQPNVEIEPQSLTSCVITLRGEHDPSTGREIALAMNLASTYRYVLVDLSECSFLDSSVLKTLLQAAELAGERGGWLEIVADAHSGNPVRRALEITRVDSLVLVHPTRSSGIARLLPAGTQRVRATLDETGNVGGDARVAPTVGDAPAEPAAD